MQGVGVGVIASFKIMKPTGKKKSVLCAAANKRWKNEPESLA